jgi:hypothetical protein
MPCPTCDHTLNGIGYGMFHCPRCGTLVGYHAHGSAMMPALVGRLRELKKMIRNCTAATIFQEWNRLGVNESILPEKERS